MLFVWLIGSASRISNSSRPPDPGGGRSSTDSEVKKSARPLRPTDSRHRRLTADEQTYPPLGCEPVDHRPDRSPVEPIKAVTVAPRITSEPVSGMLPSGVGGAAEEIGKMRPARRQKMLKEKPRHSEVSMDDFAGSVAVDATLSAILAGDVAIGTTSPVDFVGGACVMASTAVLAGDAAVGVAFPAVAEVASSAVAEVASSADIDEVASLAASVGLLTPMECLGRSVGTVFSPWTSVRKAVVT